MPDDLGNPAASAVAGACLPRGSGRGPLPRVCVAMLGARRHYAVPRLLHEAGALERFFTDLYLGRRSRLRAALSAFPLERAPKAVARLAGRTDATLPDGLVTCFPQIGLRYAIERARASEAGAARAAARMAARFADAVLRRGLGDADVVWGFNTASAELFEAARRDGRICVLDQTNLPAALRADLLREEAARWPDWTNGVGEDPHHIAALREAREWELAHHVLVGSRFVADSLARMGVSAGKIHVLPYGADPARFRPAQQTEHGEGAPLRLLFLGEVGLRKGAPHLVEALRRIEDHRIEATLAGPVAAPPLAIEKASVVARVTGPLPRRDVPELLQRADVLVLPSVAEGSAGVTYEALLSGLPLIVTPNAGSLVEDGIDGQVIPASDTAALADAIARYADAPDLLRCHAAAAEAGRAKASLGRYRADIEAFLSGL